MTVAQMRHAISVEAEARKVKRQFDGFVLLAPDTHSKPEIINVGDPLTYRKNQYDRAEIAIPDATRRLAFRQWRKEIALKYNAMVRELNQIGVNTDLRLIEFSPVTGEPK